MASKTFRCFVDRKHNLFNLTYGKEIDRFNINCNMSHYPTDLLYLFRSYLFPDSHFPCDIIYLNVLISLSMCGQALILPSDQPYYCHSTSKRFISYCWICFYYFKFCRFVPLFVRGRLCT